MTEDPTTKKLKEELEGLLEQVSSSTSEGLDQKFQILNIATKDLVTFHTDQIRNLGIISGVVAPFSLMLLQAEHINTNIYFLLAGFIVLVANIIFSQFLLHKELIKRNEKITNASVKYVFAFDSKRIIDDKKQEINNRTNGLFNLSNSLREFDKLLGLTPHDTEGLHEKVRLKKNSGIAIKVFAVGCGLILLSIFVNPVFDYAIEALQRISLH